MMATVAVSMGRSGEVVFARVVCDVSATKALSKVAKVAAFPAVSLHRGGLQLLEFTPSQRGGSDVGARRIEEIINTVASDRRGPGDVHFRMLAGGAAGQAQQRNAGRQRAGGGRPGAGGGKALRLWGHEGGCPSSAGGLSDNRWGGG